MESNIEIIRLDTLKKHTDKYHNMTAQLLRSNQQTDTIWVLDLENEDEEFIEWYINVIKYKDTP